MQRIGLPRTSGIRAGTQSAILFPRIIGIGASHGQEATAFGTRVIVETFRDAGVPIEEFVVAGGLARNELLMQIYADVTRLPMSVIGSEQGPALGSAIHAAVAAGAYPDVPAAAATMGRVERAVYRPDAGRARAYDALYAEYRALHDHFGRGGDDVMLRLRAIRNAAREAAARQGQEVAA